MDDRSSTIYHLLGVTAGSDVEQAWVEKIKLKTATEVTDPNDQSKVPYDASRDYADSMTVSSKFPSHSCHNHQQLLAYVTVLSTKQVAVIDIKKGVQIASIAVGKSPTGIDISPDQRYVYVTNAFDDTLSVIRTWDNTVIDTIQLNTEPFDESSPAGVKVSPDGKTIYVANQRTPIISVVDAHLKQVINNISLPDGSSPLLIDIEPTGKLAYVTLRDAGQVAVIDLSINLPVKVIDLGVGTFPTEISIARNKPLALVTRQSDSSLSVINTDLAAAHSSRISVVNQPFGIRFSPAADLAYVACPGKNAVSIVDVFSHSEIANFFAGDTPTWLGLTANGKFLVVSNVCAGNVTIIDTCSYEIKATIYVGPFPQLIAIKNQINYIT